MGGFHINEKKHKDLRKYLKDLEKHFKDFEKHLKDMEKNLKDIEKDVKDFNKYEKGISKTYDLHRKSTKKHFEAFKSIKSYGKTPPKRSLF